MNVLIDGNGGREAMLAWMMRNRSGEVGEIFVGPGYAGPTDIAQPLDLKPDFPGGEKYVRKLRELNIGLVLGGSENNLVRQRGGLGLGDIVRMAGIPFLGASSAAAHFEASKIFARRAMASWGIRQPAFRVYESEDAKENIKRAIADAEKEFDQGRKPVTKDDRLRGGKGVDLPNTFAEFKDGLYELGLDKPNAPFLLEERIDGVEASVMALVGQSYAGPLSYIVLPTAQDYKRAKDGDTGKNTGGMYSVTFEMNPKLLDRVCKEVIEPTIKGAERMGFPMTGSVLYTGLMIKDDQIYVLEDNMRFGDPETQVSLPRLHPKLDVGYLFMQLARGKSVPETYLQNGSWAGVARTGEHHYANLVLASTGYPENNDGQDAVIEGVEKLEERDDVILNYAGTRIDDQGARRVKGTRNLGIITPGKTPESAIKKGYAVVGLVKSDGLRHRTDGGCNLPKLYEQGIAVR